MIMVLAEGMSMPDSTMLVESRISASPSAKRVITSSSSFAAIRPCAERMRASGASFVTRSKTRCRSSMRGQTQKIWPPRNISRWIASRRTTPSHGPTKVRTASRSIGGVAMSDISRTPDNAICRVRGNWCRRERDNMDITSQFLQPFFLTNAEMLFLIDDQQPEIVEFDGFCQQRMRADDDLHIAGFQVGSDLFGGGGRCHSRQHTDLYRKPAETLGKDAAMLARKQCCWRNQRHLIARHGGNESGPQRHLGLAKAHIAADQPVRRPPRRQIADNIGNGIDLVLGLDKAETVTELGIGSVLD